MKKLRLEVNPEDIYGTNEFDASTPKQLHFTIIQDCQKELWVINNSAGNGVNFIIENELHDTAN